MPPKKDQNKEQPKKRVFSQQDEDDYYPMPPENYRFRNQGGNPRDIDPGEFRDIGSDPDKPDTRNFYDSRGAIGFPGVGPNVKAERESCLTCISQGCLCHGTSVDGDGKCESCSGLGPPPTRPKRKKRRCRWQDSSNGIFTFLEHKKAHQGISIPKNTAAYKDAVEKEELRAKSADLRTIKDYSSDQHGWLLIQWVAAGVVNQGFVTPNGQANVDALMDGARVRYEYITSDRASFRNEAQRREVILAMEEVLMRLWYMQEIGDTVSENDMYRILPRTHPQWKR